MPDPSTPSVTRPVVRLRPVPPLDPPYEDELAPQGRSADGVAGQLALDLMLSPPDPGGRPARRGRLADVGRAGASGAAAAVPATAAAPAAAQPAARPAVDPRPADAGARQAARRFLVVCLEVMNGYRPLAHLRPLVSLPDLDAVLPQVAMGVERLARARRTGKQSPAQLRVVRVCEPRAGAVEAAAVLGGAGRTWALAFRLERRQDRWVSTAVRVL